MRKYLLTLTSCLLSIVLFGQAQNLRVNAGENQTLLYLYGGLWFNPANEESNKLAPVLSDDYTEEFY